MRGAALVVATAAVASITPAVRAESPAFSARSDGLPAATIRGDWTAAGAKAELEFSGVVARVAPTSIEASVSFGRVTGSGGACPVLAMRGRALVRAAPGAVVHVWVDHRFRRPGGRWPAWRSNDDGGILQDLTDGLREAVMGAEMRPPRGCRGPLEYAWRLRGDLSGDVVVRSASFSVEVRRS